MALKFKQFIALRKAMLVKWNRSSYNYNSSCWTILISQIQIITESYIGEANNNVFDPNDDEDIDIGLGKRSPGLH